MQRRAFLAGAAGLGASGAQDVKPSRVIDTHAHFYDPSRSQGVPWPAKSETTLYRTVLPAEFRKLTAPLGVTGVVVVEASPWVEDNQWVLDLAAEEAVIVGTVGNLAAGKPGFRENLARFHKNRLYRGIRLGGLTDLSPILADLEALAGADLELDVVGGPPLLRQVVRLTDRIPALRVVIDHLPFDPPGERSARADYQDALRELGKRPRVYAKVSNVVRNVGGRVPEDAAFYRPALDELWEVFGPDRMVYGSNWPVSDRVAPYPVLFRVVREYFASRGQEATEKYFWRNSRAAYRWVSR